MQILLPTCATAGTTIQSSPGVTVVEQMARLGKKRHLVDPKKLSSLAAANQNSFLAQLHPVALKSFMHSLRVMSETRGCRSVTLVHPIPCFDETRYNYLIQAALHDVDSIERHALGGYGHALGFLLEKMVEVHSERQLTAAQLGAFVERMNMQTRSFAFCVRTPLLEPQTSKWRLLLSKWLRKQAFYRAEGSRWARLPPKDLRHQMTQLLPEGAIVWVEAAGKSLHGRKVLELLKEWRLPIELMQIKRLQHVGQHLPENFALVTVTPNAKQIDHISRWVRQWT